MILNHKAVVRAANTIARDAVAAKSWTTRAIRSEEKAHYARLRDLERKMRESKRTLDREIEKDLNWQRRRLAQIVHEDFTGIDMTAWFKAQRRKIYRQLRRKYPDLSPIVWTWLYRYVGDRLCVQQLLDKNWSGDHTRFEWIQDRVLVDPKHHLRHRPGFKDLRITPKTANAIIDSMLMARELCRGVLKITVHKKGRKCIIRVRPT